MKTVDRKEQDDEFEGLTIENIQDLKRSQLQSRDTHEWLMKRHTSKVKKRYLFFPEEIKKQLEVKKIFQNFDRDGSNFLDMDELYDMFQKNGFRISEEQLQQFFTIVDEDKDNKLSWPEFKKTAFNAKAAEVFCGIMKTLRAQMRTGDTPASRYMPLSFNNMISYLSFLASREELQTFIDNDQVPYVEKFKKYQEMIHLNQQFNRHEEPEEIHKSAKLLNTRRTVETEKEFVRKTEYQFQKQKDSFYQAQTRSTPHKNEFTPVHTATTPQNNKLPRQLKEIDAIVKSHQTPSTKYITQQKEVVNNSIKRLKQDVNQYINLAKHQYNINVDDMQVNDAPKQPIKLQIRSFETEFKNSLQHFRDDVPSFYEPKLKNLPIIEEKSKTLNQGTDLIPAHLLKELRKSHNKSSPNIGLKTFFKTTSDVRIIFIKFTRLLTSTTKMRTPQKNQYIATPVYCYEDIPAETYHPHTSHVTTSCNQFRMSSQYALHRNSSKKMKQFLDVKPILGKSLLK